jgi:hypothetical protein
MRSDKECLREWYHKLETEWLPNWVDLPETHFRWWNLLIVALDDATD